MGKWKESMRRQYRNKRNSLAAMRQSNITPGQLPNMMREMRLWFQVTKNIREIEGSWTRALRRYMIIFQGRPRK